MPKRIDEQQYIISKLESSPSTRSGNNLRTLRTREDLEMFYQQKTGDLQMTIAKLSSERSEMEARILAMAQELETENAEFQEALAEAANARGRINEVEWQKSDMQQSNEDYKAQICELGHRIGDMNEEIQQLQDEAIELRATKMVLRRKNHNRKYMVRRRNNRISSLVADNNELKKQVADQKNETLALTFALSDTRLKYKSLRMAAGNVQTTIPLSPMPGTSESPLRASPNKFFLGVPTVFRQIQEKESASPSFCSSKGFVEETATFGGNFEVSTEDSALEIPQLEPTQPVHHTARTPVLTNSRVRVQIIPKKVTRPIVTNENNENLSPLSTLQKARSNLKRNSKSAVFHPRRSRAAVQPAVQLTQRYR